MKLWLRVAGVILVFVFGSFSLYMLRYAYDQGDLRKASRYVYEFKPAGEDGKTLIALMADSAGVDVTDMECRGEIISRYAGRIVVDCAPSASATPKQPKTFSLEVEVVGFQYRALNVETEALFVEKK
jgi:hypothetical protein